MADTDLPTATFSTQYAPTNSEAVEVSNHYEICDRSGWKVRTGTLIKEWTGFMVLPRFWETRPPSEFVRSIPEQQRGSIRPEQTDRFIGEDVDEISPGDL